MKHYMSAADEAAVPVCYIVGAGDFYEDGFCPKQNDFIIAADGGYLHVEKAGIKPQVLLGDFDSLRCVPDADFCLKNGLEILRYPVKKDDTDMFLAVKEGIARGYEVFAVYGGIGGERISHTFANISVLAWLCEQNMQGFIVDKGAEITVIKDGFLTYKGDERGSISVFAYGGDAVVSLSGLEYNAEKLQMTAHHAIGISNSFTKDNAKITVSKGCIAVMKEFTLSF